MKRDEEIIAIYKSFVDEKMPLLKVVQLNEESIEATLIILRRQKKLELFYDFFAFRNEVLYAWKTIYDRPDDFLKAKSDPRLIINGYSRYNYTEIQKVVEYFFACLFVYVTSRVRMYEIGGGEDADLYIEGDKAQSRYQWAMEFMERKMRKLGLTDADKDPQD